MSVKTFMRSEAGKAIGRLKGTIVFVIKTLFIALVNLVLWLLPLMAMGYFALRPFSLGADRTKFSPSAPVSKATYGKAEEGHPRNTIPVNFREMLRTAESFLREIRFLKRP